MAETTTLLSTLAPRLLREAAGGRRQRLFGQVVGALSEGLEQLAVQAPPAFGVAAYLGLLGVTARATGQSALGRALAVPLARPLNPPEELARYLRPAVAWTMAETHRYRHELHLPTGLLDGSDPTVMALLQAALDALRTVPLELLETVVLSSLARPRAAAELVVVVPPQTALSRSEAGGQPRPEATPWPAELAAACPAGAAVVDAAAERLWLDEAVAEVVARQPAMIAIAQPASPGEPLTGLCDQLRSTLPEVPLLLLHEAAVPPAPGSFARYLTGPPWSGLARMLGGQAGSLRDWPLACYRQTPTDADVILPVAGRTGTELARRLEQAGDDCPTARLRLAPGLTAAQATELSVTIRRPGPPPWSLALAGGGLPIDPDSLYRAGLREVLVAVGGEGVPLALLPATAHALADSGLATLAAVDTTALDPAAVLAALAEAAPLRVSFRGDHAAACESAWAVANRPGEG